MKATLIPTRKEFCPNWQVHLIFVVFTRVPRGAAADFPARRDCRAASGSQNWDVLFGAPGVTNTIFAIAANQGLVYEGGQAPSGGRTNTPYEVPGTAKQWSGDQGNFAGPVLVSITAIWRFVGNLRLYVAGNFTNVNGTAAYGLLPSGTEPTGAAWEFFGTAYRYGGGQQ